MKSVAAAVSVVLLMATPSFAQQPGGAAAPATPAHVGFKALFTDLGRDVTHLPSMENVYWAAGGGALALAVHPADEYVSEHISGNPAVNNFFAPGSVIGNVVPWVGGITTYAWGRLKDQPRASHIGMDLIQAEIIASGLTQGLKYTTQRERPDGSSKTSFPSGHASSMFAFATALDRHLGWRYAVPAYGLASYVAVSRLTDNRHWLSDVVFGAAVGIISGRTVTSRESTPYPVSVNPVPGGAVVTYSPARFNRQS